MQTLTFKPISFDIHKDIAIAFRRDSYIASFGDDKIWQAQCGQDGKKYLEWIKSSLMRPNFIAVHGFVEDQVIAQVEAGRYKDDENAGYVNLFYVRSQDRRKGFGAQLQSFVLDHFRKSHLMHAFLRVHPKNVPALNFYRKLGWKDDELSVMDNRVELLKMKYELR